MTQYIRWKQRFSNYLKAFQSLDEAVSLAEEKELSDLEQQGLIQRFEYTHELAWNVLKDYLEFQGIVGLVGSRDATRSAFKNGLIGDGQVWMSMIEDRNRTTHTYSQATAAAIAERIVEKYHPEFRNLAKSFKALDEAKDSD